MLIHLKTCDTFLLNILIISISKQRQTDRAKPSKQAEPSQASQAKSNKARQARQGTTYKAKAERQPKSQRQTGLFSFG